MRRALRREIEQPSLGVDLGDSSIGAIEADLDPVVKSDSRVCRLRSWLVRQGSTSANAGDMYMLSWWG